LVQIRDLKWIVKLYNYVTKLLQIVYIMLIR